MLLKSLNDLYDRLAADPDYLIAGPGWSVQKMSFRVVLRQSGELSGIESLVRMVDGREMPRLLTVPGKTKPPGSGINPGLLWDNAQYMLGFKAGDPKPERTAECWAAFRERHLRLESEIVSPAYSAVCRFLEAWDPAEAIDHPALTAPSISRYGVFQILGEDYVHQDLAVKAWWDAQFANRSGGPEGQCLVTGARRELARLHPKIKGVAGAQSSGATIVGFNEPAYESYGKSQSFNAPVSRQVAARYVKALNAMLDGPMRTKHRMLLGSTTIAFWTDRPSPTEDIFLKFVAEGSTAVENVPEQDSSLLQRLSAFLDALRFGQEAYAELDEGTTTTRYWLVGLSPNAARISIRFRHQGTIAALLEALRRHHEDIRISRRPPAGNWPGDPEFPPTWMLLSQTARDRKDIPPLLEGPLVRAVVTGAPYPTALFSAVLRRIAADRTVNYARACLIKGYLRRNLNMEVSVSLDVKRNDPPYRLGRLFAALEKTQRDALGDGLNKTIRDSFYSSASATPGSVFPRLLRTYQHHLAKLEGGFQIHREKLVQEILAPLSAFPSHLGLADQGLFAIGYYHQTRDFYTKAEERAETASTSEEES